MTKRKERCVCFVLTVQSGHLDTVEGTFREANQPICGLKYLIIVFHLY